MQDVALLKALANERRLTILLWLREPRAHFAPQQDGDLVEDGVCALLIAKKLGITVANSYKRVIPGFEAPVLLAYSSRNRSASCRIPYVSSPKGKRVEVRFPDPSANPYLAFSAMLMAGIDGIQNKIHPGDPMDKNLYDLPPEELAKVPTVAGSLREALNCLDADRTFLTKGGVFTDDQIDAYMEIKWEEVYAWEHQPAPVEYKMYYSV